MQANPIHIPTVSNDPDWDFCFNQSQQTRIPEDQQMGELYPTCGSRESEEDITVQKEEIAIDYMSFPKEKLAVSEKNVAQLIKEKMNTQANRELIRCVIFSRIIFGKEHWKWAQALTNLAYGYLTLRGLPAQAKKHAESAKSTLLTWKEKTASQKEKKEILEALVMLYYTLGVAWLLQNHGREAYFNLQKADRSIKELKELNKGDVCELRVSEKDLTIALGRASLGMRRLNLALTYFEKAIGSVTAAKGDGTPELVGPYEEIAQIEQLRRNHKQAIQYLKQAYSICVSSFTEISPQTAEAGALLAKAYALSGEPQHREAAEVYFVKSINAYQATLGTKNCETLNTIEEFCKWLAQIGKKQEAYRLLKASLKSQVTSYGECSEKVAETFYNMGRICFAKGELRKAIQLLRKCLMIQIFIYGNDHSKSRETTSLLTLLHRATKSPPRWRREVIPERRSAACKGRQA